MRYKNKSYTIESRKLNELIATFEPGERIISTCMEDSKSNFSPQLIVITEVPDNSIKNLLLEETQRRVKGNKK